MTKAMDDYMAGCVAALAAEYGADAVTNPSPGHLVITQDGFTAHMKMQRGSWRSGWGSWRCAVLDEDGKVLVQWESWALFDNAVSWVRQMVLVQQDIVAAQRGEPDPDTAHDSREA